MLSKYRHLIDLNDFSSNWCDEVIKLAQKIKKSPEEYQTKCSGKIMGTLFYEPSTRTQMSFQTAMLRLGGSIIGFDNPETSSVAKGENLKDTTKIVSSYADIMVMRHPLEGSAKAASLTAECPIINAGDGGHLHPTQTLTDLLTLMETKGSLSGLTVGLCGDLMNGRTVHSLIKALTCYQNNRFVLISTKTLQLPSYIKDILKASSCKFREVSSIEEVIGELDVLYMTRIQKERFSSIEEYEEQKNIYVLDKAKMSKAGKDLIVLHPLPRVDEIAMDVDDDPRAMYFKQAKNGVFVRMALILTMLQYNDGDEVLSGKVRHSVCCKNPRCITQKEKYLPKSFIGNGDTLECEYCDDRILI
ncbi:MAG: aspartate carbamoyltransferase [Oscillospiraceae bacterium]